MSDELRVVPASTAPWDDLQSVFSGASARCQCTRQLLGDHDWFRIPEEAKGDILRAEVNPERPGAPTIGLVGYLDDEPVGWVSVGRRAGYGRILGSPVPWKERPLESRTDESVWAVACLIVRRGYRGRGLTYPLVAAAAAYARAQGADAIEGYPLIPGVGQRVIWDEMSVGAEGPFVAAGFREVGHPTKRRKVMRLDFAR